MERTYSQIDMDERRKIALANGGRQCRRHCR
jgi:hypothetical protein